MLSPWTTRRLCLSRVTGSFTEKANRQLFKMICILTIKTVNSVVANVLLGHILLYLKEIESGQIEGKSRSYFSKHRPQPCV